MHALPWHGRTMQHGGDLGEAMARFGGKREDWLDLSTGISPFPYPLRTLGSHLWTALPGRHELDALLAAARIAYRVPDSHDIVAAPGTQSLIQWIPRLAARGGKVGVTEPSYAEHARAWQQAGYETEAFRPGRPLAETIRHAVLVHPNNPDGRPVARADAMLLASTLADRQGCLVIDEAFIDIMPDASLTSTLQNLPVITLRSFGKFYGLAGLRLGFAIGPKALVAPLREALGPWPVTGAAIQVATIALSDLAWAEAMRSRLAEEAEALDRVLLRYGFVVVGGTSLFRLARIPRADSHAALAGRRIWTRCFDWDPRLIRFGLPAGPAPRERLARTLSELRHG
ncbi:MAG: threonine-phosphate decarboxylase CobD [Beijerinckiaceae bacterium]|nr:threonine-phosphate decarboxylase CobD [Beijerinckiaceae bacterium]MCZ8299981.1 threonine-phosphate decarboxylase CobD [Beijerinckiaceae bacterium]